MSATGSLRHQLADELRERIRAGEWEPGERLPSEPELARRQSVSRSSLRSAIAILEEEGYHQPPPRVGHLCHAPAGAAQRLEPELRRQLADQGDWTGARDRRAVGGDRHRTTGGRRRLRPRTRGTGHRRCGGCGRPAAGGSRTRSTGAAATISTSTRCRGSAAGSIYQALAARGLAIHHGVARLSPRNADGEIAERLGVPRGSLLLTIDQRDSMADGVAVLVSREHHLADAFSFTVLRHGPGDTAEGDA